MAQRGRGPSILSQSARDQFKYEIASDLGILNQIEANGWGDLPSRQIGRVGGKIGGNMVKVMIKQAEEAMARNDFGE